MTWTDLPTNYTDAEYTGLRKYEMINNGDGTVSFRDVTEYTQEENSFFGADDANAMNNAINNIMGNDYITDAPSDGIAYARKNSSWVEVSSGGIGGRTYYVSTSGSDSNNGTSSSTPFKTIGKAVSLVPVGNGLAPTTIVVAAGEYSTENIIITNKSVNMTLSGNVTLSLKYISINNSQFTLSGNYSLTLLNMDIKSGSKVIITSSLIASGSSARLVVEKSVAFITSLEVTNYGSTTCYLSASSSYVYVNSYTANVKTAIIASAGAIVTYNTISGSHTNVFTTESGARVYTGSQS